MNAEEIIDEIIDIVDDDDYSDRDVVAQFASAAQKKIADTILLPDLSNGVGTVDTVVGERFAALPETFHRGLYRAQVDGKNVDIFLTENNMELDRAAMSLDTGDIDRVAVVGNRLTYQKVPTTAVAISLNFYRLPIPIVDRRTSFVDGIVGHDDFERAIIHNTAGRFFNKIEDGMEGAKVNTTTHLGLYMELMVAIEEYVERVTGVMRPSRPAANRPWLGGV